MAEKQIKIHKIGSEVYVTCKCCKQTVPEEFFGTRSSPFGGRIFRSVCRQCFNKKQSIIGKKRRSERKGKLNNELEDFKLSKVVTSGTWVKAVNQDLIHLVVEYHNVNNIPYNEFRKYRSTNSFVLIEGEIIAMKKEGLWYVNKFCGFGFIKGEIGATKYNTHAEEENLDEFQDLKDGINKYLEKIGKKWTPQKRNSEMRAFFTGAFQKDK